MARKKKQAATYEWNFAYPARSIDRVRSILTGVLAGGEVEDLDDVIHALHLLGVRERVRKPESRLVLKHAKQQDEWEKK